MNVIERYEAESAKMQKLNYELRRIELRASIREAVRQYSITPMGLYSWLSQYPVSITFFSTSEAADWLGKSARYERDLIRNRNWKAKHGRLEALEMRWVVARYFRRFGRRVWLKQAA